MSEFQSHMVCEKESSDERIMGLLSADNLWTFNIGSNQRIVECLLLKKTRGRLKSTYMEDSCTDACSAIQKLGSTIKITQYKI